MRASSLFRASLPLALAASLAALVGACAADDATGDVPSAEAPDTRAANDAAFAEAARAATRQYAVVVKANYDDTLAKAKALEAAVDAFVAKPTAEGLEACKAAWLAARTPYGETEAFRFYGGPVDADDGPEGSMNGWPIDENYIDYVEGDPDAGLVNLPAAFPDISADLLVAANEKGGEKNLTTGWHAIEFLLWGQDRSATGPGTRPYTDYVVGAGGTAKNQDRRAKFLVECTKLLVRNLEEITAQWNLDAPGTYGAGLVAGSLTTSLTNMLQGASKLSGFELANERMNNALLEEDRQAAQEEEHSCFSDNTIADLVANSRGVENVYLGRYGATTGPSLSDLVRADAPELDARARARLAEAVAAMQAIPAPFDQALLDDAKRAQIQAAREKQLAATDALVEVAKALGVTVTIEE